MNGLREIKRTNEAPRTDGVRQHRRNTIEWLGRARPLGPHVRGREGDRMTLPLYALCPRCTGRRYVTAITETGNDFSPTRTEDFTCPVCHGTGEADMDDIMEAATDDNERFDEAA